MVSIRSTVIESYREIRILRMVLVKHRASLKEIMAKLELLTVLV
jgi:hypothetical protein